MDLETLSGIAALVEKHGLTGLKLEEEGFKLVIERKPEQVAVVTAAPAAAPAVSVPVAAPAAAPAPAAPAPSEQTAAAQLATVDGTPVDSARVTEVCAPMVGVFYAAPAPGAEPFAHVGSKVKKGDTLCILEAMKLMNEVVAECDGEVVEVCVGDGELVEYGRVLFRIY